MANKNRTSSAALRRMSDFLLPFGALIVAIAVWWIAVVAFDVPKYVVPSPADVWNAFANNPTYIMAQTWVTTYETLVGFGIAVVTGVLAAMAIARSSFLERTVYPLMLAVNAIPKVAIAPILVVWMGFGTAPKIVMVVLLSFFPIVLSTVTGLRSTPAELIELADSLDAKPLVTFRKIRFPWAMEQMFVGFKNAILLAVIGAVIGEFVGAREGLGYLIVQSGSSANTALAFVCMALLAILSIALFYILAMIERRVIPWAESARTSQ